MIKSQIQELLYPVNKNLTLDKKTTTIAQHPLLAPLPLPSPVRSSSAQAAQPKLQRKPTRNLHPNFLDLNIKIRLQK